MTFVVPKYCGDAHEWKSILNWYQCKWVERKKSGSFSSIKVNDSNHICSVLVLHLSEEALLLIIIIIIIIIINNNNSNNNCLTFFKPIWRQKYWSSGFYNKFYPGNPKKAKSINISNILLLAILDSYFLFAVWCHKPGSLWHSEGSGWSWRLHLWRQLSQIFCW